MDIQKVRFFKIGEHIENFIIPPIHQKRIVTFVNYFIVDTVSFLNKFINSAEDSLWKMEKRMRKLETSLKLLEMKLNFIPDVQETKKEAEESVSEKNLSTTEPKVNQGDTVESIESPRDNVEESLK